MDFGDVESREKLGFVTCHTAGFYDVVDIAALPRESNCEIDPTRVRHRSCLGKLCTLLELVLQGRELRREALRELGEAARSRCATRRAARSASASRACPRGASARRQRRSR